MEQIKVAAASILTKNFEVKSNINEILNKAKLAKTNNSKYIFFGEAVLNGFDGLTWCYEEDILKHAIDVKDKNISVIKKFCKNNQIGIGLGFYEKANQKIYNTYIIIDDDGDIVLKYQRISPGWKVKDANKDLYLDGNEYKIIDLGNSKCLIAICGDLWTDGYTDRIKEMKFDTIIWPLYISYSKEVWNKQEKFEYARKVAELGKRTVLINSEDENAIGSIVEFSNEGVIEQEALLPSEKMIYFYF